MQLTNETHINQPKLPNWRCAGFLWSAHTMGVGPVREPLAGLMRTDLLAEGPLPLASSLWDSLGLCEASASLPSSSPSSVDGGFSPSEVTPSSPSKSSAERGSSEEGPACSGGPITSSELPSPRVSSSSVLTVTWGISSEKRVYVVSVIILEKTTYHHFV